MDLKSHVEDERPAALFVTFSLPDKHGAGINQRAFRNLDLLCRSYRVDIVLLTPHPEPEALRDIPVERACWIRNQFIDPPAWTRRIPAAPMLWRMVHQLTKGRRIRAQADFPRLQELIADKRYDLALFFRLNSVFLLCHLQKHAALRSAQTIVDFDDIESKARRRSLTYSRQSHGRQKSLSVYLDSRVAARNEARGLKLADFVWVCSDSDREELEARNMGRARIVTMPNTIYLPDRLPPAMGSGQLLFVGLLDYFPNSDAVNFFTRQIWPMLRDQLNGAVELTIVGRCPASVAGELQKIEGVIVTGWVEDLRPYYEAANLVIVPIRFGGGTRIKILEAMAYGRPVVSTTIGCEGLVARHGREILIADSAKEIAEQCIRCLANPAVCAEIVENARDHVESYFSFENARSLFQRHHVVKQGKDFIPQ